MPLDMGFAVCHLGWGCQGHCSHLRGLWFIISCYKVYLDDILIHSTDASPHADHLSLVFHKLQSAGLTLRGSKCHIGMYSVSYLGHVFSTAGMATDPKKTLAIKQWPTTENVKVVRQFLGLVSYIDATLRALPTLHPLHHLTQKSVQFSWNQECEEAFSTLKLHLLQSPILTFPKFGSTAKPFVLQPDASVLGLEARWSSGGLC